MKNKKHFLENIIIIILIIVIIFCCYKILIWVRDNNRNDKILEDIKSEVIIENNSKDLDSVNNYEIDFSILKEKNSDTVGWLTVKNTYIDYPVLKTNNNEYYLNHNFDKEYNISGWVFADYKNKADGTDKNLVIYAHNTKNNSMFGSLKNVLNESWYNNEDNKYIYFQVEDETIKYEVFSIYQIEKEEYYIKTNFKDSEFSDFINKIKSRSIKKYNIEVSSNDNILTLSTCASNNKYRVVLHAKKV